MLGYGIPGFLLGPVVGRLADQRGRARLIPLGLTVAAIAAGVLALSVPVGLAALAVALLSLGYDLTQPLLAGIVTDLSPKRGQAMALNVFTHRSEANTSELQSLMRTSSAVYCLKKT